MLDALARPVACPTRSRPGMPSSRIPRDGRGAGSAWSSAAWCGAPAAATNGRSGRGRRVSSLHRRLRPLIQGMDHRPDRSEGSVTARTSPSRGRSDRRVRRASARSNGDLSPNTVDGLPPRPRRSSPCSCTAAARSLAAATLPAPPPVPRPAAHARVRAGVDRAAGRRDPHVLPVGRATRGASPTIRRSCSAARRW